MSLFDVYYFNNKSKQPQFDRMTHSGIKIFQSDLILSFNSIFV